MKLTEENRAHYYPMPERLAERIAAEKNHAAASRRAQADEIDAMDLLEFAQAHGIDAYDIPPWVAELFGDILTTPPTLQVRPDKSRGAWLLSTGSREWYVSHSQVMKAFAAAEDAAK